MRETAYSSSEILIQFMDSTLSEGLCKWLSKIGNGIDARLGRLLNGGKVRAVHG